MPMAHTCMCMHAHAHDEWQPCHTCDPDLSAPLPRHCLRACNRHLMHTVPPAHTTAHCAGRREVTSAVGDAATVSCDRPARAPVSTRTWPPRPLPTCGLTAGNASGRRASCLALLLTRPAVGPIGLARDEWRARVAHGRARAPEPGALHQRGVDEDEGGLRGGMGM